MDICRPSLFGLYTDPSTDDYDARKKEQIEWWKGQDGQQPNDPATLADALVESGGEEEPPRRFIAGEDATELAEERVDQLQEQIGGYPDLSTSIADRNMTRHPLA